MKIKLRGIRDKEGDFGQTNDKTFEIVELCADARINDGGLTITVMSKKLTAALVEFFNNYKEVGEVE